MMKNPEKKIRVLRYTARTVLLAVTTFLFIFALLSDTEQYGGGLRGIIMNSPNAIPWVILYLINILTWKYERIGGIVLIACAIAMTFFFDVLQGNWAVLYIAVLPVLLLGGIFIYCAYKSNRLSQVV